MAEHQDVRRGKRCILKAEFMRQVQGTVSRSPPKSPGVKCPPWSVSIAQVILDSAEPVGNTLQGTYKGVGFVARKTQSTAMGVVWHGYPEAWDRMDPELKKRWKQEGLIQGKDLRAYSTRSKVRDAFGGRYVGG